jgi:hypothetical protein
MDQTYAPINDTGVLVLYFYLAMEIACHKEGETEWYERRIRT